MNTQLEIGTIFSFNHNRSRIYVVVEVSRFYIRVYEVWSAFGTHSRGIRTLDFSENNSEFNERCVTF